MRTHVIILSTTLVALACGKAPAADLNFPEQPVATAMGSSGKLQVAIRSAPNQPPQQGVSSFEFTVTDMSGKPLDGLQLTVQPWMPEMGHGTSLVPTVKDAGGGVYQITNVSLFMAGLWELRTNFTGTVTDSVAPEFQIN